MKNAVKLKVGNQIYLIGYFNAFMNHTSWLYYTHMFAQILKSLQKFRWFFGRFDDFEIMK